MSDKDAEPARALDIGEDVDNVYAELGNDHTLLVRSLDLDNEANPLSTLT